MVILLRSISSMSGSLLLDMWGRKHILALDVSVHQDSCWRIEQLIKVCMEVWNRNWHWVGRPILPFSRWWVTLLLVSYIISSFLGPSVAWRVWFRKLHKSQEISHSFLMSEEIHIFTKVYTPIYWRWRFWISAQLFSRSPMRAFSQPIIFSFKLYSHG